ncbi:alpha-amylase family glycosyl hydrolase [Paenibacillus sp. NEAU-GSW1]|uniref:alpha-amylase family glycosyl hydrolase n=1 Tax=Paenibacillus sp. NEAU-GSW1 TaxID=2682486 RepID=UPI0012E1E442|nr:alpha-amylase family glycosyl hydrolase [Paenibacillus sp. NEAU-GSW1]MUT64548.1 DUF3459 domain-containing protein [Paenibacillus sp. NEAU-GSW1]
MKLLSNTTHTGKGLRLAAALLLTAGLIVAAGCSSASNGHGAGENEAASPAVAASAAPDSGAGAGTQAVQVDEQPGTVYYEIFVRSFYDTNGDGIGDLNGVTAKLDYLKELGIGGIWLMPINPAASYHGYDVTDYYDINPDYGTKEDFKRLMEEAHKRDIRIVMDLVVNHTSSEHPWFKEALADPNSTYRSWYRFAAASEKMKGDGATGSAPWHKSGDSQYLGVFWGGMPDLNFDEPAVREEMVKIGNYWLDFGLDGFRLDAAKHIYGDYASTINTPEIWAANKKWWQEFRSGLLQKKPDVFLIGEVWDSTSVIAPYFDQALDSAFNFDLMDKLIGAAEGERNPDIAFTLQRMYTAYEKTSGGKFTDAPFLNNHDKNRVMTRLGGNVDHARMAASLLLTMPGNPFLYYGEEIGMKGAKPDEFIREPMIWYADAKGGEGQTTWEPLKHNSGASATVSVEAQLGDEKSLFSHYRMLLKWRSEEPALRDGGIADYPLADAPTAVSLYVRLTSKERVLVAHNLSGESQTFELAPTNDSFGAFETVSRASESAAKLEGGKLTLPPYSTAILK